MLKLSIFSRINKNKNSLATYMILFLKNKVKNINIYIYS